MLTNLVQCTLSAVPRPLLKKSWWPKFFRLCMNTWRALRSQPRAWWEALAGSMNSSSPFRQPWTSACAKAWHALFIQTWTTIPDFNPWSKLQKKRVFMQRRKWHFLTDKCTFLQENAFPVGKHMISRKMRFERGTSQENRKKLQERFRAQESRTFAYFTRSSFLGQGKWGRTKYRRIPKCEGDWKGRVPKCSLPRRTRQNKGIFLEVPFSEGFYFKLLGTLHRIHPYVSSCRKIVVQTFFWRWTISAAFLTHVTQGSRPKFVRTLQKVVVSAFFCISGFWCAEHGGDT